MLRNPTVGIITLLLNAHTNTDDKNNNNNNNNNKRFYSLFFVTCIARSINRTKFVLLCREMDFPAHIIVYALAFG